MKRYDFILHKNVCFILNIDLRDPEQTGELRHSREDFSFRPRNSLSLWTNGVAFRKPRLLRKYGVCENIVILLFFSKQFCPMREYDACENIPRKHGTTSMVFGPINVTHNTFLYMSVVFKIYISVL